VFFFFTFKVYENRFELEKILSFGLILVFDSFLGFLSH